MSKHPLLLGLTLLSASLFTGQTFADRTVTDQLGRQVTLPDHVTRVVVLQHQTLNLLVQLHAATLSAPACAIISPVYLPAP